LFERGAEVAVAGEAEVEGERGEVVSVRQLDQRSREAQLRQVLMQRRSLGTREEIGEIRGRCADRARDVGEQDAFRQLRLEHFLRPSDQPRRCRPGRPLAPRVMLERRA